jgi:hypothetical protein
VRLFSHAERPELVERRGELGAAWDEFMYHDTVANRLWDRQYEEFPDLQLYLLDEDDRYLAESNAVPIPFGPGALPDDGWDAALEQAFEGKPAQAVSAIAITIRVDQRGRGLSKVMLDGMRKAVAARELSDLVAPEAPVPADSDRPLRRVARRRREAARRVASHARAGGRDARAGRAALDADRGLGLGLGVLDGHALPRHRCLRRPGRARPGRDRSRARRGRLRRAQRLDAPPGLSG